MSTALRTYCRGAKLVSMRDEVAQKSFVYHFDGQGTVQCLTDGATGAVTDRFACDAWGVPIKRTGSSINRQWYVGNLGYARQVDQALDYVRARWYPPGFAVWASKDPVSGSNELYVYSLNSPVGRIDPSGMRCTATVGNITLGPACKATMYGSGICCVCDYTLAASFAFRAHDSNGFKGCSFEQYKNYLGQSWAVDGAPAPWEPGRPAGYDLIDQPGYGLPVWGARFPSCASSDTYQADFISCLCGSQGAIQCVKWSVDLRKVPLCTVRCTTKGPQYLSGSMANALMPNPRACEEDASKCCCLCQSTPYWSKPTPCSRAARIHPGCVRLYDRPCWQSPP